MAKVSNNKVIDNGIKTFYANHRKVMIEMMKTLGAQAMQKCLEHPYMNQTYNLEDSLGYGIYVDGNNIGMYWANSPREAVAPNGVNRSYDSKYYNEMHTGRDVSELFLTSYKSKVKYELVVIAGQWYASFVENIHNLDVITNSFAEMGDSVPKEFKKISNAIFGRK